jgi:hypothetical protein
VIAVPDDDDRDNNNGSRGRLNDIDNIGEKTNKNHDNVQINDYKYDSKSEGG